MPKFNETLVSEGYFEIDDKAHQKGAYDLAEDPDNETLGLFRINENVIGSVHYIVAPVIYSEWTNSSDVPYASYAALITDVRASFFLTKSGSGGGDFLDKVTLDPQTVAGAVEFLQDITVPSGSVVLGRDGARVSSASRALLFTDSRENPTLFAEYHYDDLGSEIPHYWVFDPRIDNLDVCPDNPLDTLFSPNDLQFSGALGDSSTITFHLIPMTTGTLRLQLWEGSGDTGALLIDTTYEITTTGTVQEFDFPVPLITQSGDLQFARFSGVDLQGGLQTSAGPFQGQICPFLQFDVQLLNQVDIITEAPEDGKQYARKDGVWEEVAGDGIGDMLKSTYDPNTIEGNAFDMDNMVEGADTKVMTSLERDKLSGLESSKFLGQYVSLVALEAAHPSPAIGSYGYVDTGIGQDVQSYLWDSDDLQYVLQLGESTAETPASIKSKYESNLDTNAFTDAEQTNLGNQSGTNTGDQDLSGLAPLIHTHTVSEVTDFDTEVANNTAVSANTAKVTYDDQAAVAANTAKVSFPEAPIDGTPYAREDGGWEPVQEIGYILATWGANLQNTGRFPAINGTADALEVSGLGIMASAQVSALGTIDTLTYYNATGDNTTVFKIIKNGVVAHTFTCTGFYGQEMDIGVPVAMVDNVAIEYDAGTAPGNGIYTMYVR